MFCLGSDRNIMLSRVTIEHTHAAQACPATNSSMTVSHASKLSGGAFVHLRVCLRLPTTSTFRMQVAGGALAAIVMLTGIAHGSQDAVETVGIMKFISVTGE